MTDVGTEFLHAMEAAGIVPAISLYPAANGRLHRFRLDNERKGKRSGWYVLHDGEPPHGHAGDWRSNNQIDWVPTAVNGQAFDRSAWEARITRERIESTRRQDGAAAKALQLWDKLPPAKADHPYLRRKQITQGFCRVTSAGRLVVPVYDAVTDRLITLQFIGPDGDKRFMAGGRSGGGCAHFGLLTGAETIVICEGYATAATVFAACDYPVVVAFNCGNLEDVGKAMRERYPQARIILGADNDEATAGNPGVARAMEASLAIGAVVAVPSRPGDFNDLAASHGLEAVRLSFAALFETAAKAGLEALVGPAKESDEAVFTRLARLSEVDYDRARASEAKKLGIKMSTLDEEVRKRRSKKGNTTAAKPAKQPPLFSDLEPWTEAVPIAAALDDLVAVLVDYIVMTDAQAQACALWIMHCHCIEATDYTPRLWITSPEKRCGKSTLLRVLTKLVPRPMALSGMTAAMLFRSIGGDKPPVLLIDEADNSGLARNEELRGVINEGVYREAMIGRVVGDDHEPKLFPIFAPVVLAGIGNLPGPVQDRSIKIALRRKLKTEQRTRFDRRNARHLVELARQGARVGLDHATELAGADPQVPDELNDRELDGWRPLLSIADLAGGDWPHKARTAAKVLSEIADEDEEEAALMMLRDCRAIYRKLGKLALTPPLEIETVHLVEQLHALVDSSWAEWGRMLRPINGAGVAKLLKAYGIKPGRIGPRDNRSRGYTWAQFDDAWQRYLP